MPSKNGYLFGFLLSLWLPFVLTAQTNAEIDSLNNILTKAKSVLRTEPVEATLLMEKVLSMSKQLGQKSPQAYALKSLARLYAQNGEYSTAVEFALDALRLYEELEDQKEICITNITLGVVYRFQGKYEESLRFYRRAEEVALNQDYDTLKAAIWGNMGNVYHDIKSYDEALKYHKKSLEIDQAFNNEQGMGNSYHNIGMLYRAKGQYEQAIDYYQRSLAIDLKKGNQVYIGISYLEFTITYLESGNLSKALEFAERALEIAENTNSKGLKIKILAYFPIIHSGLGDTDKALAYNRAFKALSDSLQTEIVSEQIAEMQTKYETEQKDKELSLQNLQIDAQQTSLKQQRLFLLIFGGIFLLTLLSAYLLFNRYKLKQRNRRLQLENQQFRLSKDLEEKAQKADEARREAEHIKQLDQMKSQFFANISHEFRTPLNLILAPLQQKRTSIPEGEIGMIRRNAKRLLRLVNQLLDLARIEVGLMKMQLRNIELSRFVSGIAQAFYSLAEAKKINYQIDIPERDYVARIDPDKLEKILYNLLSNAFKFTPEEGRVSIHMSKEGEDSIRIAVSDTGIGVRADLKEKIFDRFYQIDSSKTRAYEGSGIGLALTKELVDLLKGHIALDSQEGKGSTFTLDLPVTFLTNQEVDLYNASLEDAFESENYASLLVTSNATTIISNEHNGELPILLIVEDNMELREYMSSQLSNYFNILVAPNGQEGLQVAQEKVPDLIITDIMMPQMDGFSLTKHIREDERTSHIPIILLTAHDDGEAKIKGFSTGAEQYLVKPFELEELIARTNALLAQRKRLHQKFGREVILQPSEIILPNRDAIFLENTVKVIEDNIENPAFTVEHLQKEIGMSRMQLHRKLKALTNQSTSEFIRSIKLKRAAQLLLQPGMQVTEVAYQSGFNHLSYFAKCFKEQFGVSPSEYAKASG